MAGGLAFKNQCRMRVIYTVLVPIHFFKSGELLYLLGSRPVRNAGVVHFDRISFKSFCVRIMVTDCHKTQSTCESAKTIFSIYDTAYSNLFVTGRRYAFHYV